MFSLMIEIAASCQSLNNSYKKILIFNKFLSKKTFRFFDSVLNDDDCVIYRQHWSLSVEEYKNRLIKIKSIYEKYLYENNLPFCFSFKSLGIHILESGRFFSNFSPPVGYSETSYFSLTFDNFSELEKYISLLNYIYEQVTIKHNLKFFLRVDKYSNRGDFKISNSENNECTLNDFSITYLDMCKEEIEKAIEMMLAGQNKCSVGDPLF